MATPSLPRQQRRKLKRECIEKGRKVLARGLAAELGEDEAVGVTLILHDVLADASRPQRAGEAAEIVETLLEKSIERDVRGIDLGCGKGCTFCCSALVTCSAPEIFRVAAWLRSNAEGAASSIQLEGVKAEAARRDGLPAEKRFIERAPCPLLIGGACGVYPVRPIPCRALYSMSSEACRLAMLEDKGEVPILAPAMTKGEVARTLLLAAVSTVGLSDRGIELTSGVMAVIDRPDAEARWLAGENVFEGVLGGERTAASRKSQDHIAQLAATLMT